LVDFCVLPQLGQDPPPHFVQNTVPHFWHLYLEPYFWLHLGQGLSPGIVGMALLPSGEEAIRYHQAAD
jgi:hypothetical protein